MKERKKLQKNCMSEYDLQILKTEVLDEWKNLNRKSAYAYEYFNSINDYQKPVNELKKEDFFSNLQNDIPNDEKIERNKEVIELFNTKHSKELTKLCVKSVVVLLICVFEKFLKLKNLISVHCIV